MPYYKHQDGSVCWGDDGIYNLNFRDQYRIKVLNYPATPEEEEIFMERLQSIPCFRGRIVALNDKSYSALFCEYPSGDCTLNKRDILDKYITRQLLEICDKGWEDVYPDQPNPYNPIL